jgi:hypothetical protein
MTYNEAKKVLDENWEVVNPSLKDSNPPHMVLNGIIAPEKTDINALGTIYFDMIDNSTTNEDVLLKMNLMGNNLIIYVVFKMKGYLWFQPLENYKMVPYFTGSTGK